MYQYSFGEALLEFLPIVYIASYKIEVGISEKPREITSCFPLMKAL